VVVIEWEFASGRTVKWGVQASSILDRGAVAALHPDVRMVEDAEGTGRFAGEHMGTSLLAQIGAPTKVAGVNISNIAWLTVAEAVSQNRDETLGVHFPEKALLISGARRGLRAPG